jgi:hypothetical protein
VPRPLALVVDARLRTTELAAHPHGLALADEIALLGRRVIVDPHVDGRRRPAELLDHRPVGGQIDERGEDAAVRPLALRIDDPLRPPLGLDLYRVVSDSRNRQPEPLVERPGQDHLLHFGGGHFFGHCRLMW